MLGRSFLTDDDPRPTVEADQAHAQALPLHAGGLRHQPRHPPAGRDRARAPGGPAPDRLRRRQRAGRSTRSPPATSASSSSSTRWCRKSTGDAADPETMGQLAAIGIVKGQPFAPDARMKAILTEAAALGNAAGGRSTSAPGRRRGSPTTPGSAWCNMLWAGGYNFETPPPQVTAEGITPYPPTGARTLHARTAFFYGYTGITPAMIMRLTGVGSQYLMAFADAAGDPFDGARTYTVTLPRDIPEARFWSLTLYDNQTRSMLQTEQRYPRAGSQTYPTPGRRRRRRRLHHHHPRPGGARGDDQQRDPDRAGQGLVRDPAPLQPPPAVLRQDLAPRARSWRRSRAATWRGSSPASARAGSKATERG